MRTYVLISLLSVIGLASCRPQEIVSSSLRLASLPVQTHFRYNSKSLRTFPIYERIDSPINKNYTLSQDTLRNIENARNSYKTDRKQTLTNKGGSNKNNSHSINNNNNKHKNNNNHKPENIINNNKQTLSNNNANKHKISNKQNGVKIVTAKPVTPISLKSSSLKPKISTTSRPTIQPTNYYSYKVQDSKTPPVRPFFSQESQKPQSDTQNKWFELKLKPPKGDTKNYDSSTLVYPSVVYPSNSYPTNPYISDQYPTGLNSNKVYVGNTVTLSPEVVSISQGTHTLAGPESNPCPTIHITSNLYNKQACQDVDIVINNHLHTENNVYSDDQEENIEPPKEGEIPEEEIEEYDDEDYEEEVTETATEEEVTSSDDYVGEEDIAEDEFIPEADTPVEDPISGGNAPASDAIDPVQAVSDPGGSSSGGNRPGLPNFPNFTRPSLSNDEDDEEGGLFDSGGLFSWASFLNPFNIPLFGILAAPLTILFTGALGISTFFLPWTVLPTLFLSRKAKQSSNFVQNRPSSVHPDGWFWHSKYKTWVNMNRRIDNPGTDNWADSILKMIEEYGRKYYSNYNESWKRRKKYI